MGGGLVSGAGGQIRFGYTVAQPVQMHARVEGAVSFESGGQELSYTLARTQGECSLGVRPNPSTLPGSPYTVTITLGNFAAVLQGKVGESSIYVPLTAYNALLTLPTINDAIPRWDALNACAVHIRVQVFYDTNRDGIRQPGEPPYARAIVELWQGDTRLAQRIPSLSGEVSFFDLPPGDYALSLVLAPYLKATTPRRYYLHADVADLYGPYTFGIVGR